MWKLFIELHDYMTFIVIIMISTLIVCFVFIADNAATLKENARSQQHVLIDNITMKSVSGKL